ncbi:unnamed protein product, partial [Timema podura]|nr:unnamed protein product [Timema podura]
KENTFNSTESTFESNLEQALAECFIPENPSNFTESREMEGMKNDQDTDHNGKRTQASNSSNRSRSNHQTGKGSNKKGESRVHSPVYLFKTTSGEQLILQIHEAIVQTSTSVLLEIENNARVNEKGFPKESFVVKLLEDSVSNQQEQVEEDNCEFSKKLSFCLGLKFNNVSGDDAELTKCNVKTTTTKKIVELNNAFDFGASGQEILYHPTFVYDAIENYHRDEIENGNFKIPYFETRAGIKIEKFNERHPVILKNQPHSIVVGAPGYKPRGPRLHTPCRYHSRTYRSVDHAVRASESQPCRCSLPVLLTLVSDDGQKMVLLVRRRSNLYWNMEARRSILLKACGLYCSSDVLFTLFLFLHVMIVHSLFGDQSIVSSWKMGRVEVKLGWSRRGQDIVPVPPLFPNLVRPRLYCNTTCWPTRSQQVVLQYKRTPNLLGMLANVLVLGEPVRAKKSCWVVLDHLSEIINDQPNMLAELGGSVHALSS